MFEQIFTQEGVSGQTGVYNESEAGSWGNTDGVVGGAVGAQVVGAGMGRVGLARVRNIFRGAEAVTAQIPNKGFISRRADMRSGGGADPINGTQYAGLNERDEHAVKNTTTRPH